MVLCFPGDRSQKFEIGFQREIPSGNEDDEGQPMPRGGGGKRRRGREVGEEEEGGKRAEGANQCQEVAEEEGEE